MLGHEREGLAVLGAETAFRRLWETAHPDMSLGSGKTTPLN